MENMRQYEGKLVLSKCWLNLEKARLYFKDLKSFCFFLLDPNDERNFKTYKFVRPNQAQLNEHRFVKTKMLNCVC